MRFGYRRDGDEGFTDDAGLVIEVEADLLERPALHRLSHRARAGDVITIQSLAALGETLQEAEVNASLLLVGGAHVQVQAGDLLLTTEEDCPALRMLRQAAKLAQAADRRRWSEKIAEAPAYSAGRPKALNEDAVADLLARGMRPIEIARELGVHRMTVHRYAKRLEAPVGEVARAQRRAASRVTDTAPRTRPPRGRPRLAPGDEVLDLKSQGHTIETIAEMLGISTRTVNRRLGQK